MAGFREQTGSTRMRPRARLISLLGDELISDERVAVVELVKNAYDADAQNVYVTFEQDASGSIHRLVIRDDGHGMALDDILGGWFEPGTIHKKRRERSPAGRLYQGAKGVGRFAAARLGKQLLLETKKSGSDYGIVASIEWGLFDDESYLDEVEVTYKTAELRHLETGTILAIDYVQEKKEWCEDDFQNLHYRLSRLISPFQELSGFKIHLDVPGLPDLTGEVQAPELTRTPKYRFSGILDESGAVCGKIKIRGAPDKKFEDHAVRAKDEVNACGPFAFDVRVWDRDREGLAEFMSKFDMSMTKIRQTLNAYCGVSIYRDGFRVHPYGEVGNDWLSLDNRSRQNPTKHLAKNQIIASIDISRITNPELKDRTTREGLVHNEEYEALIDWFTRVLSLLEEERYRVRRKKEPDADYSASLFESFDLRELIGEAKKQLGDSHAVAQLIHKKEAEIQSAVERLQEHYSRVLLTAGLGQLVDLVIHEIGAPLGRIVREMKHVRRLVSSYELAEGDEQELEASFDSIQGWLEQVANLRGRLDPRAAGRRGRSTSFNVADEINGNIELFDNLIRKQKITVSFTEPRSPLRVHMPRSVLGQVVANLLDNSVYWLGKHFGAGKGGQISLRLRKTSTGFQIQFSDDGPGINPENRDLIFDQYFTTKPNGMGLGLYIARQIIEPHGKIILGQKCDLPGACFDVIFERRVGL